MLMRCQSESSGVSSFATSGIGLSFTSAALLTSVVCHRQNVFFCIECHKTESSGDGDTGAERSHICMTNRSKGPNIRKQRISIQIVESTLVPLLVETLDSL